MDIRIASENAKIGFVYARRGIVHECCSSWFLPRVVGISRALEWSFSGRVMPAQELKEGGLNEAAGHAGAVTTMVLVQRLAELLKIPIITAGGVATGSGLVATLALGASAVSMGTRYLLTQESPLHLNFKNKAVELDVGDTIYSDKFDGIPCRQMKTEAAERLIAERLNIWSVFLNSFSIAKELKRPYLSLLKEVLTAGPQNTIALMRTVRSLKLHTITLTTGDLKTGMTSSGMSVGLVHDIPTVAEVIERIVAEAYACQRSLNSALETDVGARLLHSSTCARQR